MDILTYSARTYQFVHKVGDGSWNANSVFLVRVNAVCEENEEWEGETGHSSPNHPWPVHQHIQSSDFIRVTVPHCSPKSNHLLVANVNKDITIKILPEMQLHRRGRKDRRGTKRDQWILFQGTLGIYLKAFQRSEFLFFRRNTYQEVYGVGTIATLCQARIWSVCSLKPRWDGPTWPTRRTHEQRHRIQEVSKANLLGSGRFSLCDSAFVLSLFLFLPFQLTLLNLGLQFPCRYPIPSFETSQQVHRWTCVSEHGTRQRISTPRRCRQSDGF